jgi:hypothetical protein
MIRFKLHVAHEDFAADVIADAERSQDDILSVSNELQLNGFVL